MEGGEGAEAAHGLGRRSEAEDITGHHQEMGRKGKKWDQLEGEEGRRKFALSACWWFLGWEDLGMFTG